jgi:6,7-dimethyl-8-ribityllumazine synthase
MTRNARGLIEVVMVVDGLIAVGMVVDGLIEVGMVVDGLIEAGMVVDGLIEVGMVVDGLIEVGMVVDLGSTKIRNVLIDPDLSLLFGSGFGHKLFLWKLSLSVP